MISEEYIMELLEEYAKSPEGKKLIKEKYGIDYNGKSITIDQAKKCGRDMKEILFKHVNVLIKSITLDDIVVGDPYVGKDGKVRVDISFREGSLERKSLNPERTLNNIVLLFERGFAVNKRTPRGDWIYRDIVVKENTTGRHGMPANEFLQNAVADFNNKNKGIATAKLQGVYK